MNYRKVKVKRNVNGVNKYYVGYYHGKVAGDYMSYGEQNFAVRCDDALVENEQGELKRECFTDITFLEPLARNSSLRSENEKLKKEIEDLKKQNEEMRFDFDRGWIGADNKREEEGE